MVRRASASRRRKGASRKRSAPKARRRASTRRTFRGRGAYNPMDAGMAGVKSLLRGGGLGGAAKAAAKNFFGLGSYSSAGDAGLSAGGARISNPGKEGAVHIRNREYVGPVYATTPFVLQNTLNGDEIPGDVRNIVLNPGLASNWPWLSNIAKNFQQYEWNGLMFEYQSTCGVNNAGSSGAAVASTGSVIMATSYDAMDAPFTNKKTMLNSQMAVETPPTTSRLHAIECSPQQSTINRLYVRSDDIPTGADPRFYDFGKFYFATEGMATGKDADEPLNSNPQIGSLWVTYDVLLYKPTIATEDEQTLSNPFFRSTHLIEGTPAPPGQEPTIEYPSVFARSTEVAQWSNFSESYDNDVQLELVNGESAIVFPEGARGHFLVTLQVDIISTGAADMGGVPGLIGASGAVWPGFSGQRGCYVGTANGAGSTSSVEDKQVLGYGVKMGQVMFDPEAEGNSAWTYTTIYGSANTSKSTATLIMDVEITDESAAAADKAGGYNPSVYFPIIELRSDQSLVTVVNVVQVPSMNLTSEQANTGPF